MDEAVQAVLESRARRYAEAAASAQSGGEVGVYTGCRIGQTVLGIPVALVHEFAPLRHWTPLKGRRGLLGVTHLRGDVMALVDLGEAVAGKASEECEWMVVLQGRGGRAAAPVKEVVGMRRVNSSELLPPEQTPAFGRGVSGVTADLWFLLDPAAVAAALEDVGAEEGQG